MDTHPLQSGKQNDHAHLNRESCIDRLLALKRMPQHLLKEHSQNNSIRKLPLNINLKPYLSKASQQVPSTSSNTVAFYNTYGAQLNSQRHVSSQLNCPFLANHDIDKGLRARMLDWMIQVTSSYEFQPKTYFASATLMDRFFMLEKQKIPIGQLHIVGVSAMLIASKMNQVFPFKIKTIYEKIVHRKIEKMDIANMESHMAQKLDFELNCWDFYDLAMVKLHSHQNKVNQEILNEIQQYCAYVGKYLVFNYELYSKYDCQTLAQALLRTVFKLFETQKVRSALGSKYQSEFTTSKDVSICSGYLLKSIRNFKSEFKNMHNICKYTKKDIVDHVDSKLRTMLQ